jgi:hypothetical protein
MESVRVVSDEYGGQSRVRSLAKWIINNRTLVTASILLATVLSSLPLALPWLREPGVQSLILIYQTLVLALSAFLVGYQVLALRRSTDTEVAIRILEMWVRDHEASLPDVTWLAKFTGPNSRYAYLRSHPDSYYRILSMANFFEVVAILVTSNRVPFDIIQKTIGGLAMRFYEVFHEPLQEIVGERYTNLEEFCRRLRQQ